MSKSLEPCLNVLISYAYYKNEFLNLLVDSGINFKLLVDSGAFTVWKAGKTIHLQDYMDFIKGLPVKPWKYFNLDVIGDGEKTLKNYEIMLDNGLKPIPVFTRGEKFSMIDYYYKTSDVIGIGGLVGTKNANNFLKKTMQYVKDRKCGAGARIDCEPTYL